MRCVILDIGGVLELTPATGWTGRWEARLGLAAGSVGRLLADVWEDGEVGALSEEQVRRLVGVRLELDAARVEDFMGDLWAEYLGSANEELIAYVRGLPPRCRVALLSNSFVGAREREAARYGFDALAEQILYSHETGLRKPDPRAYALACDRLEVAPDDCLFVDDVERNVRAARTAGMRAHLFESTEGTIARIAEFSADLPDGARSEAVEQPVQRRRYAVGVQRLDQEAPVTDLAPLLRTEEAPHLPLGAAPLLRGLAQEDAQGALVAVLPEESAHPVRAERADQLLLQVGGADEEVVRRREEGTLPAAYVVAALRLVAQPGEPQAQSGRAEESCEAPDAHRPAHRQDAHALGRQVPAAPLGQRVDGGRVAEPFEEDGRTDGKPGGQLARGVPRPAGRPRQNRRTERRHISHAMSLRRTRPPR